MGTGIFHLVSWSISYLEIVEKQISWQFCCLLKLYANSSMQLRSYPWAFSFLIIQGGGSFKSRERPEAVFHGPTNLKVLLDPSVELLIVVGGISLAAKLCNGGKTKTEIASKNWQHVFTQRWEGWGRVCFKRFSFGNVGPGHFIDWIFFFWLGIWNEQFSKSSKRMVVTG